MYTPKYWKSKDIEDELKKNTVFTKYGSDLTGKCIYTFNELGFRGDSIYKKGFRILSIGCSNTEGIGVNDDETWPRQFSKLVKDGVDFNFGKKGMSNDYISRCLITYHDLIKPDLVLIMYTSPIRREYYTEDDNIFPFLPNNLSQTNDEIKLNYIEKCLINLQNNKEDVINWYKNHLLIKYFLETKKTNWLWNGNFNIPIKFDDYNRFDKGYYPFIDYGVDNIHCGPKNNKNYANKLYKHIEINFPNYLEKTNNDEIEIIKLI